MVQAAVIREITMGTIPQRESIQGRVPFNLMKSEQFVWVIDAVDCLETVTRRESRGTSQGVSVRVQGFQRLDLVVYKRILWMLLVGISA